MQILSTEKIGRLKRNWPRLLLLLVIVVLSLHLIVVVSTSASGWRSLWNDWEAQVLDLLGEATSVSEEIPSKQAKYWLKKVEQIPETQTDPQVALGAAWMLAEPQYEFLKRNIKTTQEVQELSENLFEIRDQSQAEYQALCRTACLKQAAIATRLAPENVDYWRQRALLLFAVGENSELVPSIDDWRQVLKEAAAHDPENALYDYLAALQFYQLSAESVWDEKHRLTLKITNPRVYAQAEQRLQAGLKKTNLDVGTITWSATLAFLEQTSLPLEEQIAAAESRNAIYSAEIIVIRLLRWLNYACESDLPQKKYAAVIRNARWELLIADQLATHNNLYESTFFKYLFRTSGQGHLFQVMQLHPTSFTAEEAADLRQDLQRYWLEYKIFFEALDCYHKQQKDLPTAQAPIALFLMELCQRFIFYLLPLVLLLTLTVWLIGQPQNGPVPYPGWWRNLIAWFCGVNLSLLIWGVIPADAFPEQVWEILLLGLCWIVLILILTCSLRLIRKRENLTWFQLISLMVILATPALFGFQFTSLLSFAEHCWIHASLALIIPAFLLLIAIYGVAVFVAIRFLHLPGRSARQKLIICSLVLLLSLLILPAGAELMQASLSPAGLQTWMEREVSATDTDPFQELAAWNNLSQKQIPKWIWIYPHWTAHHGAGFAVLFSLSILLGWSIRRWSRFTKDQQSGSTDVGPPPKNWHSAVRLLKHPSLTALFLITTVYLAVTPTVIIARDNEYQRRMEWLENPLQPLQKLDSIKAEIKNDPVKIQRFNQEINEIQQRLIEEAKQIGNRE